MARTIRPSRPPHPRARVCLSAFVATGLLAAGLTIGTVGCSARSASPYAGLSPQQARQLAATRSAERNAVLAADRSTTTAAATTLTTADHRRPANVLILSGGDADGAFGCGILAGQAAGPGGGPRFDVVTGVSTGALIATFAFLGEPADHEALRAVYTTVRDADVFEGPFDLGPPNSLFGTTPLRRLIAARVTPDVFRRVAAAHAAGRRLYVSTVELESGETYVWPLSKLAFDSVGPAGAAPPEGDPQLARFRDVLLAAAAIPVLFPPVAIGDGLHVDAGLREAITLRDFMLGAPPVDSDDPQPAAAVPRAGAADARPVVWAVVNGKLRGAPETVGDNVASIGVRSLKLYTESLVLLSLRDAAHVAAAHGPAFRFRWVCEPDELDPKPSPSLLPSMFDPAVTVPLYQAGYALGVKGAWADGPPPLDADARLPLAARR